MLAGELDLSTAARVAEVLKRAERACCGSLVVDLQAVLFADCAGARPCSTPRAGSPTAAPGSTSFRRLPRVALVLAYLGAPTGSPGAEHQPANGWPPRAASRNVST